MTALVAAAPHVTERPATALDDGFFRQVFVADRLPEFLTALPPAQAEALAVDQFRLQTLSYADDHPLASHRVILWRGRPVGRVIDAESARHVVVVDIVLDPTHRGVGIGTQVLERIQGKARASERSVRLHAVIGSPAVRWYESLGFMSIGVNGTRFEMEWTP